MVIGLDSAVHAQSPNARCDLVGLRHDHSTVPVSAEILRRKKAEGADRCRFAGHHPLSIDLSARADRLSCILDHWQIASRIQDGFDRRHLTEQVDGNDCLCRRLDAGCDRLRRDVERVRLDIREYWTCSDVVNRARRREERERRSQDLVSAPNIERAQREQQRVGSVGHADGVLRFTKGREIFFERGHERSAGEGAAINHGANGLIDFFP